MKKSKLLTMLKTVTAALAMMMVFTLLAGIFVVMKPRTAASAAKGFVIPIRNGVCGSLAFLRFYDEDDLSSDSACGLASAQSIKAYIDSGTASLSNKTLVAPTITGTATGATVNLSKKLTVATDITVTSDATGGDAGARSEIQGKGKFHIQALGDGTNGSTETVSLMDDTPSSGGTPQWDALENSAADVTVSDYSTVYRVGSNSLRVVYGATAGVGDGITANLTDDDWGSNESVGGWIMSSVALSAGDLILGCYDSTTVHVEDVPAVPVADVWTWVEINIAADNCDMDTVRIVAGTTAIISQTIYYDGWYKWDADDEESLGENLVQDGVAAVTGVLVGATSTSTTSNRTEHTDYFINYQSGDDVLVWIADHSGTSNIAYIFYQ